MPRRLPRVSATESPYNSPNAPLTCVVELFGRRERDADGPRGAIICGSVGMTELAGLGQSNLDRSRETASGVIRRCQVERFDALRRADSPSLRLEGKNLERFTSTLYQLCGIETSAMKAAVFLGRFMVRTSSKAKSEGLAEALVRNLESM